MPLTCLQQEGNWSRGQQETGHRLLASGGQVLWWLALWCSEGGQEAGSCPSKAHGAEEEAEAISHLWGRLGILLQQGNAVILGNRVPALPDAHINGVF